MHPPATLTLATHQISLNHVLTLFGSGYLVYYVLTSYLHRNKSTPLRGPPSKSYLFGVRWDIGSSPDSGEVYERWAEEYGPVYRIPDALGMSTVVIADPKAIAHFYAKETFGYVQTTLMRKLMENMVGPGLLCAEGEVHRRQRKALSPAFSNAAIRKITPVFFDSAYELKSQWDNMIDSSGASHTVIEVQQWMNRISLDSMGHAGFSHAFNTLSNLSSASPIQLAFDSFTTKPSLGAIIAFTLARIFPVMLKAPTNLGRIVKNLKEVTGEIGKGLLARMRLEADKAEEKSIIGLLIKTENANTELRMTQEELIAQVSVLLLAGYETTSIALTWALIELCKNPTTQDHLRAELLQQFPMGDPTWEQLANADVLPYLDAVIHEVLRLHPPLPEIMRVATEDDILPLSTPLRTSSGSLINNIHISKGTSVTIPIMCVNRSVVFWGEESKVFKPERWLDAGGGQRNDGRWQEISGYRHLLTFADGPRVCLGKGFALAEIKAVLSVLIRNYTFTFPGKKGVNTEIENIEGILIRPKITDEEGVGACVSLRVGRIE